MVNDFILNGLLQMEKLLGDPTFTWKGATFGCVPNTVSNRVANDGYAFEEEDDFRMTVRMNQFTPNIYPQPNDYITYRGFSLLVKEVRLTPHNVFLVLVCSNPRVKGR